MVRKAVETSNFPETHGHHWRIPNVASIAGAVATAVGALVLFGIDPLEVRFPDRLIVSVLLAASVWGLTSIMPSILEWVVRARNYEELRDHALTLETLLIEERYRTRTLALRLSYVVSSGDALAVIGIILDQSDGPDLLALDNIHGIDLSSGDKMMIIDSLTWDFLGSFTIVGQSRDAILAAPTDTPDSLWWGYLRQQAVVHAQANTRAVAIRIQN